MDGVDKAFADHADVRASLAEHIIWPDDLAGLVQTKRGLELLVADADARIGPLVRNERASGTSWATIGEMLGVSKQAAQQRYGSVDEQNEAMLDKARAQLAGGKD